MILIAYVNCSSPSLIMIENRLRSCIRDLDTADLNCLSKGALAVKKIDVLSIGSIYAYGQILVWEKT